MNLYVLYGQKIKEKDYLAASHVLETISMVQPTAPYLLLELATVYVTLKDLRYRARARECLERYIAVAEPIDPVAITLLAVNVYRASGPIEKLKPLLDKYGHLLDAEHLQQLNALATEQETYEASLRKVTAQDIGRLPSQMKDLADLRLSIRNFVLSDLAPQPILKDAAIFTFGSCFANNVARVLKTRNFDVDNFWVGEEVNTTFSNLNLVKFILGKEVPDADYYGEVMAGKPVAALKEALTRSSVIIYTMGVAPAFFQKETGRYVPHSARNLRALLKAEDVEYRFSTVDENVAALTDLLALLREHTNIRKMFVTVSPVPLASSIGFKSTICADTESKSILRAAAGTVTRRFEDTMIYFPSFEVLRWLPSFQEAAAFGADDGNVRHPNESYVAEIVEAFIERFGG
ncbi:MAG TPA: GSCFA domain-containing protein [Dongiaceae bacterium]|nr:GSCFA domain-containing protein [Dongiaceae bacterium]